MTLGGRQVDIRRPRVRTVGEEETEAPLETYQAARAADLLTRHVVGPVLAGVSTRR